ncbi:hypothetical protein RIF29_18248 [Crotalaria pallida]|uniref:Uncharacterized protein n=1 Tax=Crotalaria pallida TaxID=3830 RepID=A0AAN9FSC0_CROPI
MLNLQFSVLKKSSILPMGRIKSVWHRGFYCISPLSLSLSLSHSFSLLRLLRYCRHLEARKEQHNLEGVFSAAQN